MTVSQMSKPRPARTAIEQMIFQALYRSRFELAVQVTAEITAQVNSPTSHGALPSPTSDQFRIQLRAFIEKLKEDVSAV